MNDREWLLKRIAEDIAREHHLDLSAISMERWAQLYDLVASRHDTDTVQELRDELELDYGPPPFSLTVWLYNRQDPWDPTTTYDWDELDDIVVKNLMPLVCGGLFKSRRAFVSTARRRFSLAS